MKAKASAAFIKLVTDLGQVAGILTVLIRGIGNR